MLKKTTFYLSGLLLACFGVSLIINSNIGAGPWDAFTVGATERIGLTVGIWVMILQAFYLLFNSILAKKRPQFESIITILLWGVIIDFYMGVVLKNSTMSEMDLPIRVAIFITGIILLGIGAGVYLASKFPTMPYDGTMVIISEKFHLKLNISRTILELIGLGLALLVGGPIGLGTVIILMMIGPLIQICLRYSILVFEKI